MSNGKLLNIKWWMSLLVSCVLAACGNFFMTGGIQLSEWMGMAAIATTVSFILVDLIPVERAGAALAIKMHAKPGSVKWSIASTFVLTTFMTLVLTYVMTLYASCIVHGVPIGPAATIATQYLIPYLLISYVVAFILCVPVDRFCGWLDEVYVKYQMAHAPAPKYVGEMNIERGPAEERKPATEREGKMH